MSENIIISRVNKGLCPICNLPIKNPQSVVFQGKPIPICGFHVVRKDLNPLESV